MSPITKLELAVEIAERLLRIDGYGHRPCLGATLREDCLLEYCVVQLLPSGLVADSRR